MAEPDLILTTFWKQSLLPVQTLTILRSACEIYRSDLHTKQLHCRLTNWVPLVYLIAFEQEWKSKDWQIHWQLTTLPVCSLKLVKLYFEQFCAKARFAAEAFQLVAHDAKTWKVTNLSDDAQAQLEDFCAAFQTLFQTYGIGIKIQPVWSDKKQLVNELKTSRNQFLKQFLHQKQPPPTPVAKFVKQSQKTLEGKIISLFEQPYKKTPYYRLSVDNERGVFTLHLTQKLTKSLAQPLKLGTWWRFQVVWKERFYEVLTLKPIPVQIRRLDHASTKRIEFHVHTKMSSLDGIGSVKEYLDYAKAWNHPAIAFTDHENVHSFAECAALQAQYPEVKIIYGCEFNYLDRHQLKIIYHPDAVFNLPSLQLKELEYVFFDLETTGLIADFHHIIEFAAVVVQNGLIKERHSFFIQTTQPIPAKIWKLTNIQEAEYRRTALPLKMAFAKIEALFANRLLIAHNAAFDIGFLTVLYNHFQTAFHYPVLDTLRFSHLVNPTFKRHTLQILARKLKLHFNQENLHRALYDADLLSFVFDRLINKTTLQTIHDLIALNGDPALFPRAFPHHVTILAKNQAGLKDLYKLVSISHTQTLANDQPLLQEQTLTQFRRNLLVGAPCYNSELFQLAISAPLPVLIERMRKYDFLELQPPEVYDHFVWSEKFLPAEIENLLTKLLKAAKQANLLVIASGDVHYLNPEDRIYRNVLVSNKLLRGKRHPLYNRNLKPQQTPLQYFRTTNEMKAAFHFLNASALVEQLVITNPQLLNAQIEPLTCFSAPPIYPVLPAANATLEKLAFTKLHAKFGKQPNFHLLARLKDELQVIIQSNYATIYLIAYQLATFSLANNFLFSSRGSVGSSFLAYCLDITEVNPLAPYYHCLKCHYFAFATETDNSFKITVGFDLPPQLCPHCQTACQTNGASIDFSAFLGIDNTAKPDIDLNFSGWFQEKAQLYVRNYLEEHFGKQHVFRAGTISTIAERSAYNLYRNFLETEYDDQPHLLPKGSKERIIYHCTGIKRTTGQHPGGLMIIPQNREIYDYCPYNYPSNNQAVAFQTTHFDYHVLNDQLLKIDILGHDDPTGLKILHQLTGIDPQTIPFHDRKVVKLFSDLTILGIKPGTVLNETTGALGLPEYGTGFVRKILQFVQVQSFADLIAVSGLSHGTNVWENNAKTLMQTKQFSLNDVIACRDDIFVFLTQKRLSPQFAFQIMQQVKYGKGLKTVEIQRLKAHDVPDWFIDSCQKITYLFPRAHATAYALMAYRFAWFKLYYPHQFYAMYYTIRCAVFDLSTLIQGSDFVFEQYQKLQKLNRKRFNSEQRVLTTKEKALLPIYEIALEMFARGIKLANLDLIHSQVDRFIVKTIAQQPVIIPPFTALDGLGREVADSIVKARNEQPFRSQNDFKQRTRINQTLFKQLQHLNVFAQLPESNQQTFTF